jgi:hypothetical protein
VTPDSLEPPVNAEAEMNIGELKLLEPEPVTNEGLLMDYDAGVPKVGRRSGIEMVPNGNSTLRRKIKVSSRLLGQAPFPRS